MDPNYEFLMNWLITIHENILGRWEGSQLFEASPGPAATAVAGRGGRRELFEGWGPGLQKLAFLPASFRICFFSSFLSSQLKYLLFEKTNKPIIDSLLSETQPALDVR